MPFNGAGVYTPPGSDFPAVSGTLIQSTKFNNVINDIATALSTCIAKDGQTTITAHLPMSGFRHTGVAAATALSDYARVDQVQNHAFYWCGTAGGTADALTLSPAPGISAYATGQEFWFLSGASPNTGAATLQVSGLASPKAIQIDGVALAAGAIAASKLYRALYDGTAFQLSRVSMHVADLTVEDQILTDGVIVTSKDLGTIASGTVTPDPGDRPAQHYTNGGAHTLAPSSNVGSLLLDVTNNASAGAITTSGFTKVSGDLFTTTNGHKFRCHISIGTAGSLLQVKAMQ